MFQDYSKRALQIVFEARFKAGQRGSDGVDVGDLLFAFVMEDQDRFRELILQQHPEAAVYFEPESHPPFLSPDVASHLLVSLEGVLPHSVPVATSVDLPITPDLQVVFEYAETLRNETGHSKIEPLHLLAGVLHAGSGIVIDELQKAGITYDSVMSKLQKGTNEE